MYKNTQQHNLKRIASRVFNEFNSVWNLHENKAYWIYNYANYMDDWSTEPKTLLKAYKFCINNLDHCPSLSEFRYYCEFISSGEKTLN